MAEFEQSPTDGDGAARATSDALMAAIERLTDTETRKRQVATDSSEFLRLAVLADEAGQMVARWTATQLDAASKARRLVAEGAMSGEPIERVAPRRVAKVLADWREAEYRLTSAAPGSPEALAAAQDAERLRTEYQEATAAVSDRLA
jgi:hypothetical protein